MRMVLLFVFTTVVGMSLAGCGREATDAGAANGGDTLPTTLLLADAPRDAQHLKNVKASAKEGDTVTVLAVIGGRREPIADNRAILTVIDPSVETCDRNPDDACTTPWDACCEPQEVITAASATVQVVDAEGRPLRRGLRGVGGIEPLRQVIVVGTVRGPVEPNNLVIDASGIHVLK